MFELYVALTTLSLLLAKIPHAVASEIALKTPVPAEQYISLPQPLIPLPTPTRAEKTPEELAVDKLEYCESRGRYDIRVLDVNGKYSYGGLQFQLDTFWGYGLKYGVFAKGTTREQAKVFIYQRETQRQIAEYMVRDNLFYHWKNCAIKTGLL